MSALLSIGLHCKWLSLDTYSSKVQSTSKSVSNDETNSLSTTSSKFVDGGTNSALLKQLVIACGETQLEVIVHMGISFVWAIQFFKLSNIFPSNILCYSSVGTYENF